MAVALCDSYFFIRRLIMLKKYISVYACITAVIWMGLRLFHTESFLIQFLILFTMLFSPMAYVVLFFIESELTIKQKYLCCFACILIALTAHFLTKFVNDTYRPTSLSDGLGYAFVHIFFTFYTNIIVPAILLIGTIICHIISLKKKR